MTLRIKLSIGLFVSILLLSIGLILSHSKNEQISQVVSGSMQNGFRAGLELREFITLLQELRRYEKEYFLYIGDMGKKQKYFLVWHSAFKNAQELLRDMQEDEEYFSQPELLEIAGWKQRLDLYGDEFKKIVEQYYILLDRDIKQKATGGELSIQANEQIRLGKDELTKIFSSADTLVNEKINTAQEAALGFQLESERAIKRRYLFTLVACFIILAMIVVLLRSSGLREDNPYYEFRGS